MSGILRNMSMTLARQLTRSLDPRHDYEPHACYNSFCKHWQQAHDIIVKSQPQHLYDDVLGVVNHLEQLTTLLVLEARAREINSATSPAACLEFLLSENLLDKLYEWAVLTGKYENAVRLEELKLFGHLISHYSTEVIAAEPFLRPLLKLLSGFRNELPSPKLESQLVTVLKQLCVTLVQNMKFIDLFFLTTHAQNGSHAEFILVRLLLASVHREGSVGSAARDALLLCANMSAKNMQLADYMLAGNTCPVLATGLSGLYSLLPRTLDEQIHRLTADDVNQVNKLTLFIDSLEFCNAVAQVAHPTIKKLLLDLLYQGFLVPVMGPALLQTRAAPLQTGLREQTTAMCYLELILRCVTERGLLKAVLHFLFVYEYDSVKVIDVLLNRMAGNSQMSLVSLSVMETLINLNCEDVMLELVFKYLLSGQHLVTSQRHNIANPDCYRDAAFAFLSLSPNCCGRSLDRSKQWADEMALTGRKSIDNRRDDSRANEGIAMNTLVQDKMYYGNPNESLIGNYHAYLCDARFEIVSRTIACAHWTRKYNSHTKRETNNNKELKETQLINNTNGLNKERELNTANNKSKQDNRETIDPNTLNIINGTGCLNKERELNNTKILSEQDNRETIDPNTLNKTNDINCLNKERELNTTNGISEQENRETIDTNTLNITNGTDCLNKERETNILSEQDNREKIESDTQEQNDTSEQNSLHKDKTELHVINTVKEQDSLISICTSEYDTLKTSETSEKEQHSLTSLTENVDIDIKIDCRDLDSLISIGESSDYESFKFSDEDMFAEDLFRKKIDVNKTEVSMYKEMPVVRNWRASAETVIGPLLNTVLTKTASLLESEVVVNSRVTSVISKLASLPAPLLTSLLLCPSFVLQPNVPSLYQILSKLKEEIDELTSEIENIPDIVDKARIYLMNREFTLLNVRAPNTDDNQAQSSPSRRNDESLFTRIEPKRRSLSTFTNMFARRLSSSSPSQNSHSLQSHVSNTSPQRKPVFIQDSYWNQSITHQSILNAVLLDEWLKELAALCEEQALRLAIDNDEGYVRAVAL